jgi:glucosyl-3-phosphoglycerate synthase
LKKIRPNGTKPLSHRASFCFNINMAKKRRVESAMPGEKITVVVPVLNESRTIASVVRFAKKSPLVGEVLVVDDGSIDGTPELAAAAGARVVTSSMLGKGASMEDALQEARHEILLFLDGDLRGLHRDLVQLMVTPLLKNETDFVKAKFTRSAGRVTVLTAKPLLRTYFPELAHLTQPLGGIIATRRELLRELRFENDYGVDIGLLIDALAQRARIFEVDIGSLKHDSKPLELLGDMATQVARTILERAAEWGRLRVTSLRAARERERVHRTDLHNSLHMLKQTSKLALLDMDGTLLNGRYVMELARRADRVPQLTELLDNPTMNAVTRTRKIASVFAGIHQKEFSQTAREIPLMDGAVEMVVGLRKLGYLVGIVTDSYRIAAETVRRRVFADFVIAHVLKFRNDKATGRLTLAPAMLAPRSCRKHKLCKLNVLHHLSAEAGIALENVLAIGDSDNDACMLHVAGESVAFNPKSKLVRDSARHVVKGDLRNILPLLGTPIPVEPELRQSPYLARAGSLAPGRARLLPSL